MAFTNDTIAPTATSAVLSSKRHHTPQCFTLIGDTAPKGLSRVEIKEIFAEFGSLYGEGLRFPNRKYDLRFFVDFSRLRDAYKAFKTLNGQAHAATGHGYVFNLRLSPDVKHRMAMQLQKRKLSSTFTDDTDQHTINLGLTSLTNNSETETTAPLTNVAILKNSSDSTTLNSASETASTTSAIRAHTTQKLAVAEESFNWLSHEKSAEPSIYPLELKNQGIAELNKHHRRCTEGNRNLAESNTDFRLRNVAGRMPQSTSSSNVIKPLSKKLGAAGKMKHNSKLNRRSGKQDIPLNSNEIIDLLSSGGKKVLTEKEEEEFAMKQEQIKLVLSGSIGAFKYIPESNFGSSVIPVLPQLTDTGNIVIV